MCTRSLIHYDPNTLGNVLKNKIFGVFPHQVTNNLTIGLPYAWKDSEGLSIELVGKGFWTIQLHSIADATQTWKTPRKMSITHKEEDRLLLNILCQFLCFWTIFCGYWSLVGRIS